MSYSSHVYQNYCFNCDQSNKLTRYTYNAIRSIPFVSRMTSSGDAIQCACDNMFNSPCGFPRIHKWVECTRDWCNTLNWWPVYTNCGKDVCTAATCWSSFYNINVFLIGIGNYVYCIKDSIDNGDSQFDLQNYWCCWLITRNSRAFNFAWLWLFYYRVFISFCIGAGIGGQWQKMPPHFL